MIQFLQGTFVLPSSEKPFQSSEERWTGIDLVRGLVGYKMGQRIQIAFGFDNEICLATYESYFQSNGRLIYSFIAILRSKRKASI